MAIAIIGAAIAAAGNDFVSWENGKSNIRIETFKAESARIFEVIKTGNPDSAAKNLDFLLNAGLIQTPETASSIKAYLDSRTPGQGISLPNSFGGGFPISLEELKLKRLVDKNAQLQDMIDQLARKNQAKPH